jgi:hypothetical protein
MITFEEIKKSDRDLKVILRRYNFRKPRREASPSEQINSIFIFDFEEKKQKDDLQQQQQQVPLHQ